MIITTTPSMEVVSKLAYPLIGKLSCMGDAGKGFNWRSDISAVSVVIIEFNFKKRVAPIVSLSRHPHIKADNFPGSDRIKIGGVRRIA